MVGAVHATIDALEKLSKLSPRLNVVLPAPNSRRFLMAENTFILEENPYAIIQFQ